MAALRASKRWRNLGGRLQSPVVGTTNLGGGRDRLLGQKSNFWWYCPIKAGIPSRCSAPPSLTARTLVQTREKVPAAVSRVTTTTRPFGRQPLWHAHHETALASLERGSPSLTRRMGWRGPSARNLPAGPQPAVLASAKNHPSNERRCTRAAPMAHLINPAKPFRNTDHQAETLALIVLTTAPRRVASPNLAHHWCTAGAPLAHLSQTNPPDITPSILSPTKINNLVTSSRPDSSLNAPGPSIFHISAAAFKWSAN